MTGSDPIGDPERAVTRGFLFADLRGYTAFVEANGDRAAARLLDAYRALVRTEIERVGGTEIKTEGDSFYIVFRSAGDAVRAGLAIAAAASEPREAAHGAPIQVGIGVHAGETVAGPEGYVGSAVNIAARVCAKAAAGEVLVTDTVRSLIRTSGDLRFVPRGRSRLKGIAEPIQLYAASPAAGEAHLPARAVRARPAVLAAALVAVAVAAGGIVFAVNGAGLGRSAGSAPPGESDRPSTNPARTQATPAGSPGPLKKGDLGPGTWDSEAPGVDLHLAVDAGWRTDELAKHSIRLALVDRGASKATIVVGQPNRIFSVPCGDRNDVVTPSLDNLLGALQDNDDLETGPIARRYVQAQPTLQMDAVVVDGFDCYSTGRKNIRLFTTSDLMSVDVNHHEQIRVLLLNFGGSNVVTILLQAPSAAEFDILAAKAEILFQGLVLSAS